MTSERTPTDEAATEDAKSAAINIYDSYRDEVHKRQLSNTENYDKSILTLSSSGLAISLTFLKLIIPLEKAQYLWMINASWVLFLISIFCSLVAYLVSNSALDAQLSIAEKYYIQNEKSAFNTKNNLSKINDIINIFVGIFFVFALTFTVIFVIVNINSEGIPKMSKSKEENKCLIYAQDSARVPMMQKTPKKNSGSAQVPSMQQIDESAQVPRMQAVPISETKISTPKQQNEKSQNKSS